MKHMHLIKSD